MERHFIELSYDGSQYAGWQIQPNAITVQEVIQTALSKIYNTPIDIVGCGRTDAGVHASQFYCHVDLPSKYEPSLITHKLNSILPFDIGINRVVNVKSDTHARFDAASRSYKYFVHFKKDPFLRGLSFRYNQSTRPDLKKLNEAAGLLKNYNAFYPFCKSNTEVDHFLCDIFKSEWSKLGDDRLVFEITANRFLRGMVRMVVGMCIFVGIDKYPLDDVVKALDNQSRLEYAWSVPAEGLFLSSVTYPFID